MRSAYSSDILPSPLRHVLLGQGACLRSQEAYKGLLIPLSRVLLCAITLDGPTNKVQFLCFFSLFTYHLTQRIYLHLEGAVLCQPSRVVEYVLATEYGQWYTSYEYSSLRYSAMTPASDLTLGFIPGTIRRIIPWPLFLYE